MTSTIITITNSTNAPYHDSTRLRSVAKFKSKCLSSFNKAFCITVKSSIFHLFCPRKKSVYMVKSSTCPTNTVVKYVSHRVCRLTINTLGYAPIIRVIIKFDIWIRRRWYIIQYRERRLSRIRRCTIGRTRCTIARISTRATTRRTATRTITTARRIVSSKYKIHNLSSRRITKFRGSTTNNVTKERSNKSTYTRTCYTCSSCI